MQNTRNKQIILDLKYMLFNKQFHKFLIVGLINTLFFYSLYALLLFLDFSYIYAILGANSIGVIFSFKNFGKNVFNSNNNKLLWKFIIVYLFLISIYTLIVSILRTLGINDYVAGLLGLLFHIPISFIVNKKIVYTSKD